jgi:CubicO group peptidase (beta-lactamase class C family)
MKSISIYASLIVLLFSCTGKVATQKAVPDLEHRVDSLVQTYLDSSKIAGVAIAVFKGEEKLLLKSYGYADLEFDVKMPVDASFEIGSVTKQFTAAAILQLVAGGKLKLEDDITKYLNFDTQKRKVTILNLLTHTSGIPGYTEMPEFESISLQSLERDTLLRMIEKKPFDFEPGERLIYSNTGFFMLGLIIEKVTGLTYEEYVKKNLFEKASMENSYYASNSMVIKNRAHGYATDNKELVRADYLNHLWPYAAGSLCCTAEDLARWNNALHHGKILNDSMYKEFITPARLNDGTVTRYAKGINVTGENERRMLAHGGGINGFVSENRFFPSENLSIVVLINSTGPVSPGKIAEYITTILLGKPPVDTQLYKGNLSGFTGTFQGRGRGEDLLADVTVSDSTIQVKINDARPRPLSYWKDNKWRNQSGAIYEFVAKNDTVRELRIDQVGGFYILKKTSPNRGK